jgi:plastocyanin
MRWRFALLALGLTSSLACGSSSSTTSPTPVSSGPTISIVMNASTMTTTAYQPNPMTVTIGSTVTWVNNDVTTHTSVAEAGAWNSGNIAPGASFSRMFVTTGTFTYHCSIHPGMVGTLTVQ